MQGIGHNTRHRAQAIYEAWRIRDKGGGPQPRRLAGRRTKGSAGVGGAKTLHCAIIVIGGRTVLPFACISPPSHLLGAAQRPRHSKQARDRRRTPARSA